MLIFRYDNYETIHFINYHFKLKVGNFIDFSFKNDNGRHICCPISKISKNTIEKGKFINQYCEKHALIYFLVYS